MFVAEPLRLCENETDAQDKKVPDKYGEPSALIKMSIFGITQPVIVYCPGVGISRRTVVNENEVWFFISAKAKTLYVSCRGYKSLDPIRVDLSLGCTYRMTLCAEGAEIVKVPDTTSAPTATASSEAAKSHQSALIDPYRPFSIRRNSNGNLTFAERIATVEQIYILDPAGDNYVSRRIGDFFLEQGKTVIYLSIPMNMSTFNDYFNLYFKKTHGISDFKYLYKNADWSWNSIVIKPIYTKIKGLKFALNLQCFDLYQNLEYNWSCETPLIGHWATRAMVDVAKPRIKKEYKDAFDYFCSQIPVAPFSEELYSSLKRPGYVANWSKTDF